MLGALGFGGGHYVEPGIGRVVQAPHPAMAAAAAEEEDDAAFARRLQAQYDAQ